MIPRGTVQRNYYGVSGTSLPQTQHLAATAEGWEWSGDIGKAHVFVEIDSYGTCKLGAKCEKHAECVARTMPGAFPVVLQRDANAQRREEIAAKSAPAPAPSPSPAPSPEAKSNAERVAINREGRKKHAPDAAEVYEHTAERLGEHEEK